MNKENNITPQIIDDRIDAFIRGMMTEEEEQAFKQEIQADHELRAQVMATVSMIRRIREQGSAHDKAIVSKYDNSRVRSVLAWACSIAAVIAIFFGYSKDKRYDELSGIVSPYYSEYSMSEYFRGDVDSATVAHLYTLFNNIKAQRNMSKIIEELEPIYSDLDSDFTYSAYANDIAWNLALAYIKNDQIDKAVALLNKIEKDNPDTPIAVKVNELKKKLQTD